jgi:uncharacterized protein (DUF1697 family)
LSQGQNDGRPTHVALPRGINVGGRNSVAMADLREVVLGLGHTEVATCIQSGNVFFTSEEADTATIAAALERAIAEHLVADQQRAQDQGSDDEARVVGTHPVPARPRRPRPQRAGTARNWPTVNKLLAPTVMADVGWFPTAGVRPLPVAAVHDLFEQAPVGPLDRGERAIGRDAERNQPGAEPVLGNASSRRASSWSLTAA